MKCTGILLLAICLQTVCAELDNTLLETFESVVDEGLVSESCTEALALYVENLNETDSWSLQMLDATSKIPVGLFSLNLGEVGQFSQCLATESQDGLINPKYCLGGLPLSALSNVLGGNHKILHQRALRIRETAKILTLQDNEDNDQGSLQLSIFWAICLPSDCTDTDVGTILTKILSQLVLIKCQVNEDINPPLTGGAIAAIAVLSIFALLLVVSTGLDLYFRFTDKDSPHILLVAFSVYSNGQKLFRINKSSNEMSCLNGIRVYSMMWVIAGHVFSTSFSVPLFNTLDVLQWVDKTRSMTIMSGTLAVDSFLLLAGLLVAYTYMKAKYHGVKFNIFQFYIHRLLRLTPALAATVLVTATLLKYMGSGPVWDTIITVGEACQKNWWSTLLYVQNYVNEDKDFCLSHSWYLSVDMQLFAISPLILLPLWKYPKIGVSLIGVGVAIFIIVPFIIAYITEIPAFLMNMQGRATLQEYMRYYYVKTHGRAAPWFIGLFLGYILAKIKFHGAYKYLALNRVVVVGIWGACLAVILTCVYGGQSTLMGSDYSIWASSFYIALVRPAWALCLAWVIFACESGYGGPINWLLSFPIYQVLGRFTYSLYLVHYPLLLALNFNAKAGIYFDETSLAYSFWGITMFSFGLSVIWVLAFESPVVVLEKVLFGGVRANKGQERRPKNSAVA